VFTGDPKPISVDTGRRLAAWLEGGQAAEPIRLKSEPSIDTAKLLEDTSRAIAAAGASSLERLRPKVFGKITAGDLTESQGNLLLGQIDARMEALAGQGDTP